MENLEIMKIRSGWLGNPEQIKEDLVYMNIRRRELFNFKISRADYELVTSNQLRYTTIRKSHKTPLTEAELSRNERYVAILARITYAVNHITRKRLLSAMADEMNERYQGHAHLRKSRIKSELRQKVDYKEK